MRNSLRTNHWNVVVIGQDINRILCYGPTHPPPITKTFLVSMRWGVWWDS